MSRAAAIYYCPFCSEEDLRPLAEPSGAWECTGCRRGFVVTPAAPTPTPHQRTRDES